MQNKLSSHFTHLQQQKNKKQKKHSQHIYKFYNFIYSWSCSNNELADWTTDKAWDADTLFFSSNALLLLSKFVEVDWVFFEMELIFVNYW